MGIPHNVHRPGPLHADDLSAMFNQRLSNSATLQVGLNKQPVEFTFTILPWRNRCKPDDRALTLRNEHSASSDLLNWDMDRVRMSQ